MLADEVIAEVVAGPLDGFVARRDALAKELKAAGETDDSAAVKRLRKPSRLAWSLDAAVRADDQAVERVAAAVHAVLEAQDGRGDMREANRALRDNMQAAAAVAASAAADAGLSVARADLVPALMAVVGDATAFDRLRKAHLVEIPAAGGFEIAALTTAPRVGLDNDTAAPGERTAVVTQLHPPDAAATERARKAVDEAGSSADARRAEADDAERGVEAATAAVEAADRALQQAEADARDAADRLRAAKRAAKTARDTARQADRTAAAARAKLQEMER